MSSTLLPPNATPLERQIDAAMTRILDIPVPTRLVKNPRRAPAEVLPWLAWEYSVDEWDHGWTENQKRDAILSSVDVHRVKGTIGAVRRALAALGYETQVQEWFQQLPLGEPFTFRLLLNVDQIGIDLAAMRKILAVLDASKNLRSHMSEAALTVSSAATLSAHSVVLSGHEITLANYESIVKPEEDKEPPTVTTSDGMQLSDGHGSIFIAISNEQATEPIAAGASLITTDQQTLTT